MERNQVHILMLKSFFLCLKQTQRYESNLVTNPVQGIFTLTQILDQFLGLQQTHALFLGFLQQEVPQVMQLLQTSLEHVTKVGSVNKVSDKKLENYLGYMLENQREVFSTEDRGRADSNETQSMR